MFLFSFRWAKIGISVGLLAVLMWSTDVRGFAQHVFTARAEWVLLAFLGYLAGQVLSAYKWRLLAQPLGFQQPLHRFIVYYFVGMYLNLVSPSTVLGDVGRGVFLATQPSDLGPALQSVLADRVSGVVTLLWVCAAGVLLAGPTVLPVFVSYAMLLCAILTGIVWWALPSLLAWPHVPFGQLRQWIARLVTPYWTDGPLVRRVCTLSVLFHVMQLGLQALLVHALGLAVPLWYLFLVVPVITLLSFLPVSVSGLGVREGGYVFFFVPLGIGTDEALAFSMLWTIIMMAAGLIGGIMLFFSPTPRVSIHQRTKSIS